MEFGDSKVALAESKAIASVDKAASKPTTGAQKEGSMDEAFWYIHGHAYDLSQFVQRHPGGELAINLGRGRDCTALFESYHPFTEQHRRVLQHFAVNAEAKAAAVAPPKDDFYGMLKLRCRAALQEAGCPEGYKADATRCGWYLFIICMWISSWILYARGAAGGAVLLPLASWLMGALGHDASHFAICRLPWLNHLGTILGMGMIASPLMWYHQHTYAHHSHTNEHEADPDLHHRKNFRLCKQTDHAQIHRLQAYRIYTYAQWSVTAVGDALVLPLKSVFTGFVSDTTEIADHGGALGGSAYTCATVAHTAIYLAIIGFPVFVLGISAGTVSVTMQIAISGWLFGFFSQINHINEAAEAGAALYDEKGEPRSWSIRQVESSVNWANGSYSWFLLSNGLNYQIEHHLFPGVNQAHLCHIAPIVERTCEEYGVKYNAMPSFWSAVRATAEWYTCLSRP